MSDTMEGPLSKWTNVMKGWQYRWFVLDESSGILSYYTSKDKMVKGSRRGCVRLKGAIIGIDDEDDSTFTITVDHKTFHFQARDEEERERWIEALENAICNQCGQRMADGEGPSTLDDFEKKLMETDAYLQLLINQNMALERKIDDCPNEEEREKYSVIKVTADAMIEAIKHSIVQLQISKESLRAPVLNGTIHDPPLLTDAANFSHYSTTRAGQRRRATFQSESAVSNRESDCNDAKVVPSQSSEDISQTTLVERPTLSTQASVSLPNLSCSVLKLWRADLLCIGTFSSLQMASALTSTARIIQRCPLPTGVDIRALPPPGRVLNDT
ncbi:hypothetical protein RRG08_003579 [Elysia crispata]|uniref:PH domain-containing protein n=1 Tax=Elysia crispata TaxID=231223 RepID=A0AAE1CYU3_9GAST|nr:hypothetical protein RRG08_003579 [Elysia crispata]